MGVFVVVVLDVFVDSKEDCVVVGVLFGVDMFDPFVFILADFFEGAVFGLFGGF